jgi:hypothetical protein
LREYLNLKAPAGTHPSKDAGDKLMDLARTAWCLPLSLLLCASPALSQSAPDGTPSPTPTEYVPACDEAPPEDAMVSMCAPPSLAEEARTPEVEPAAPATISLTIPTGTPLRIAVDQRARIDHPGEVVHGKVVETVYAFDQGMIPAGSVASGHVKSIAPVSGVRRAMAYANGDFTPFRKYEVTFDSVTLPDGRQLPIATAVTPGTAQVVHLVSNPAKQNQSSTDRAKSESKGKIQEAKERAHESWDQVTAPGKLHRLRSSCSRSRPIGGNTCSLGQGLWRTSKRRLTLAQPLGLASN